ncbi:MAG TPA: hypothetical protein VF426_09805 [Marmoricola sp.]
MTSHHPELIDRVHSQRDLQPALYGRLDFDTPPFRFTVDPAVESALPSWVADRAPYLADERLVELMRTATMLGDVVADPYASLVETYGVPGLIRMLKTACRDGIDAVPDAPAELKDFIAVMETVPEWVDMGLVEQGARASRTAAAFLSPFVTRGAFLGTFINTYAALPMAVTGALSGRRAAVRVNETTSFFAVTTLPGALDRHGPGLEAAAMVRLMHSMVRVNALQRGRNWDAGVYGMPIPQVDQMPAGMINMYLIATMARRQGRTEFTRRERAVLEFTRYRAYLLGLPEELLPTTPQGVVDVFHARAATLRDDFTDEISGELVRSTMNAYLRPGHSRFDRTADSVERSVSKFAFVRAFCNGDEAKAATMSVTMTVGDRVRVALAGPFIMGRFILIARAYRRPALRALCDRYTIRTLHKRLATYGVPEFTTDAKHYPYR